MFDYVVMGDDALADVDSRLRVHGVAGLRVANASVMPPLIRFSTTAATVTIGAADMIREAAAMSDVKAIGDRRLIHERKVICKGYLRPDGLWDIEGRMADVKTFPVVLAEGSTIEAGQSYHGMTLCLTLDDEFTIRAVALVMSEAPTSECRGDALPPATGRPAHRPRLLATDQEDVRPYPRLHASHRTSAADCDDRLPGHTDGTRPGGAAQPAGCRGLFPRADGSLRPTVTGGR